MKHIFCFFFFQAEDGIRDYKVTGVQTCALPISTSIAASSGPWLSSQVPTRMDGCGNSSRRWADRKSTRLNSSHLVISYAVFCLKKKKKPATSCVANYYSCLPLSDDSADMIFSLS